MKLPPQLTDGLKLPLIVAPMFLVSGPELVVSACKSGAIGSFPTGNARTPETLDSWLDEISSACTDVAAWSANLVTHQSNTRFDDDLALIVAHRSPLVITALGGPQRVINAVHSYGGYVFADVNSVAYARKAVEAGADGLILVGAGAGGHTGPMAGLPFLAEVREFFDGPIVLGGGLGTGAALRAVEVAGADLGIMGTRFIAATESLAPDAYREMLVDAQFGDLTLSDAITGVPAYWLDRSLRRAGLDPANLRKDFQTSFEVNSSDSKQRQRSKRWSEIWSAGHGVGSVKQSESVTEVLRQLVDEYWQATERGPCHCARPDHHRLAS